MQPFLNRYFLYTLFIMFSIFFGFFIFIEEISYLMNGLELNHARTRKEIYNIQNLKPEKKIVHYDLYTDSSIVKYVSNKVSFDNLEYVPDNLVELSSEYVFDKKKNDQLLRKVANDNLQILGREFYLKFEKKLEIVSAYRSYEYQKWIKDRGCPDNLCAKAGYSEHQSGLAIDLFEASTEEDWKNDKELQEYTQWLNNNAYKYGFINTYQKGLEIDGYEIEPWHWRYVWVQLAEYIIGNDLTFAEFYHGESK